MAAGYRSYEAFWIGGLSAPGFVPPPEPTGSILLVLPKAARRKVSHRRVDMPIRARQPVKSEIDEQTNHLALQIQREDSEIISVIIALC